MSESSSLDNTKCHNNHTLSTTASPCSPTATPNATTSPTILRSISVGDAVLKSRLLRLADPTEVRSTPSTMSDMAAAAITNTKTDELPSAIPSDPVSTIAHGAIPSKRRLRVPFVSQRKSSRGLQQLVESQHVVLQIQEEELVEEDDEDNDEVEIVFSVEGSDKLEGSLFEESKEAEETPTYGDSQPLRHASLASMASITSSVATPRTSNGTFRNIFRRDRIGISFAFKSSLRGMGSNRRVISFRAPSSIGVGSFRSFSKENDRTPPHLVAAETDHANEEFYGNLGDVLYRVPGSQQEDVVFNAQPFKRAPSKRRRCIILLTTVTFLLIAVIVIVAILVLRPSSARQSNTANVNTGATAVPSNTSMMVPSSIPPITAPPTTISSSVKPTRPPAISNTSLLVPSSIPSKTAPPTTIGSSAKPTRPPAISSTSKPIRTPTKPVSTPTNTPVIQPTGAPVSKPITTTPPTDHPTSRPTTLRFEDLREILEGKFGLTEFSNKTSLQYRALRWLVSDPQVSLATELITERYVLALLFFATTSKSANWTKNYRFLSASPTCSWNNGKKGVFCDELNRTVVRLALDANNLKGSIPTELGALTDLEELDLAQNKLAGSIPRDLWNLTKLTRFILSSNSLRGRLSNRIGKLSNIEVLDVSRNRISGSVPTGLGLLSKLTLLNVSDNKLIGTLPTQIGSLQQLTSLDCHANSLNGSIRLSATNERGRRMPLSSTLPNLKQLHLGGNKFSGTLPTEMGLLTKLESVTLFHNSFHGSIPKELILPNLRWLDISHNNLTRAFPSQVAFPVNISYLNVGFNHLTGPLPFTNARKLPHLTYLNAQGNKFNGTVPLFFATNTSLESLYVECNNLTDNLTRFCNRSSHNWTQFSADCSLNCSCCTKNCKDNNCTTR